MQADRPGAPQVAAERCLAAGHGEEVVEAERGVRRTTKQRYAGKVCAKTFGRRTSNVVGVRPRVQWHDTYRMPSARMIGGQDLLNKTTARSADVESSVLGIDIVRYERLEAL